jgi:hypothetical protein
MENFLRIAKFSVPAGRGDIIHHPTSIFFLVAFYSLLFKVAVCYNQKIDNGGSELARLFRSDFPGNDFLIGCNDPPGRKNPI